MYDLAMPSGELTRTHYRACTLCEAICGLEIRVENGEIVSIRGDRDDPLSRGHICPKAVALQDLHQDPDRLRRPLRKTSSGEWEEIGWTRAFDEAARRLGEIQGRHGRDAVGIYLGNPNVHNSGSMLYGPSLLRTLGSKNSFSATSVDQLPHHVAATLMFGHRMLIPVPDVDRTDFFLVMGANPLASNGSMMTAPGMKRRLKELRARGGRLVVVDPRRTETARVADQHLFVRPGTDALLLAALLEAIFEAGDGRVGRLEASTESRSEVRRLVAELPAERVAARVGIPASQIRSLARELSEASSAVCYGRLGLSTQDFGSVCQWLINVLNVVTGNLDRAGGAMFARPAIDVVASTGRGRLGNRHSRVRELPAFAGELPVAALAEEILTPGEGQIRALVTVAGNPVLSTPNGRRLEKGLESLELMVSVDPYLNETTRHADLILPPTSALERDHYDLAFHALAVRNTARYSPPLFEPEPDSRHDWQIMVELERRLDRGPGLGRLKKRALAVLGPRRLLDLGLRFGPYGSGLRPFGKGLGLRRLERSPHGVDLGPLEPCLPRALRTPNQRIALAPQPLRADFPRLVASLEEGVGDGSLRLIGRRQVRSNNSWLHNVPRLMRGKDRCTLMMSPPDADRLGLESGGRVTVTSRSGQIEVVLEVSDEMMPGVVSLPHGWGHDRPGARLSVARRTPGASLNDLTDESRVDAVSGNAVLSDVPVEVTMADLLPASPRVAAARAELVSVSE